MSDDASLLHRYVEQRSDAAFTELVRRHIDFVYSTALRRVRGDRSRAQEVTQRVFIDLARKAPLLSRRPGIAGWLFVSTRYAAAALIRSEQRRENRDREIMNLNEHLAEPDRNVDWTPLRHVLDDVLADLNATEREAVLLRCLQQQSFAAIGSVFQINEEAARKRVGRALEKLQRLLKQRGITSTGAAVATVLASENLLAAPAGLAASIAAQALTQAGAASSAIILMTFLKLHSVSIATAVGFAILAATIAWPKLNRIDRLPPTLAIEKTTKDDPESLASNASEPLTAARPITAQLKSTSTAALASGEKEISVREARRKMEDNGFRDQLAVRARGRLEFLYGPLLDRLALAPAQVEQLKDLMIEKQQGRSDAANVARAKDVQRRRSGETFFEVISANQNTTDRKIESLLGAAGYAQYLEYERSFPARTTANMLRVELAKTDEPLSPDQLEKLVDAIARATPARNDAGAGLTSQVGAGLFPLPVVGISYRAISAAQSFLSPMQVAELTALQQRMSQGRTNQKDGPAPR
ncbi:MAG: sigma-70 family RNA polymerase sigma factor [Opitutaceae bacterium]